MKGQFNVNTMVWNVVDANGNNIYCWDVLEDRIIFDGINKPKYNFKW